MANLSERLRDMAEFLADDSQSYFLAPSVAKEHAADLATILDRLTVEGLAGVIGVQLGTMGMTTGLSANLHHDLAVSLLTYITTPSVEETHD